MTDETDAIARDLLEDSILTFRRTKELADRAITQATDEGLHARTDEEANSIAILMQHLAGNMMSRWTDFLDTDGEKPDRNRDSEFEAPAPSRQVLLERWERGWGALFATLESLVPTDLGRRVTIRGQPHTVVQAINRQLSHYGYHVGQIVQLARQQNPVGWQTLSIARGQSKAYVPKGRF